MNAAYRAAVHAMQSGVAMEIGTGGLERAAATPKQLRVGINVALVESSALWKLMVDKGIITESEMAERLVAAHEEEAERYAKALTKALGTEIKLA